MPPKRKSTINMNESKQKIQDTHMDLEQIKSQLNKENIKQDSSPKEMSQGNDDVLFLENLKQLFCQESKQLFCDWEQQVMRMLFYRFNGDMKQQSRKEFFLPISDINPDGTLKFH
jgi:hypothetical protein